MEQLPLADQAARTTALMTGEVDCIGGVDLSTVHLLKQAGLDSLSVKLHAADAAFPKAVDAAVLFSESASKAGIEIKVVRDDGGTIIPVYAQYVFAGRSNLAHGTLAANRDVDGWKSMERWWYRS